MPVSPLKILLIEDNPGDARLIREMLSEIQETAYELEIVDRLSPGIERLAKGDIDIVLLDLSLPDSFGLDTCKRVHRSAPDVVVIVLTGLDDVKIGAEAVKEGAQDYLVKGKVDSMLLERSMRYAIERQRMLRELKAMSNTDDLTGLFNRRGLTGAGEELIRLARRMKKKIFLLFADLDHMKWINDSLGHLEGDNALRATAEILRQTFRESDIIARIGGDEFVVLGITGSETGEHAIKNRFNSMIEDYNREKNTSYELSMSTGVITYNSLEYISILELLARADKLMYEQKRNRRPNNNG